MFGRLTGIARRVEALVAKTDAAQASNCSTCHGVARDIARFFMGKAAHAAAKTPPAKCRCGRALTYVDIVFVVV